MDIRLILYYGFILTGCLASAAGGCFVGRKKGLAPKPLGICIALALGFGLFGAVFMGQLQNFVMSLTGLPYYVSRMRIYGGLLVTPVMMYFTSKLIACDFPLITDIIAPGAFLILGFSKIGCACYGCCYGIECSFGVKSPLVQHTVFPVQLLECALCFILFAVMLYAVIKNKHRKGTAYPIALILYGVVRFFVEYLRYYPEAERTFFFGVNFWQMMSVITVIAGCVWLIRSKHRHHGNGRGLQKELPQYKE